MIFDALVPYRGADFFLSKREKSGMLLITILWEKEAGHGRRIPFQQ